MRKGESKMSNSSVYLDNPAKRERASDAHLGDLNNEQRRAVRHGCDRLEDVPPLLIIAGAGSGKTNTLAHISLCQASIRAG
jgi:late competence protein required for DNA uptake (superfamily II DNA/RNA helicase)